MSYSAMFEEWKHGATDVREFITYLWRFARVILLLGLARDNEQKCVFLCLEDKDCLRILAVSTGMKTKRGLSSDESVKCARLPAEKG